MRVMPSRGSATTVAGMSTTDSADARGVVTHYEGEDREWYEPSDGYGWVIFAGTMMLILATLNGIDGVAAIANSKFFTHGAYIVGDLDSWGWVLLGMSFVQGAVALGVWLGFSGARWLGVGIAAVNAIVQLVFIPAAPLWSLSLFTLDMLVIYGLAVHGARELV
jgi:hypothetical protein